MNVRAAGAAVARRSVDAKALWIGVGAGLTAILCCVSPVVLFLLGVSTAAEAITLGDRLYYGFTWYFRGVGVAIAIAATLVYLRRRRSCTVRGAAAHWRTLLGIAAVMVGTYVALYAATGYLAALGSRSHHG